MQYENYIKDDPMFQDEPEWEDDVSKSQSLKEWRDMIIA